MRQRGEVVTLDLSTGQTVLLVGLMLWEACWKGLALWRASRRNEPYWFVALLFINTAGVFPILYLLATSTKDDVGIDQTLQGI